MARPKTALEVMMYEVYAKMAETFGVVGVKATTMPALRQAMREGFERKDPTLIEVPVGVMPSP